MVSQLQPPFATRCFSNRIAVAFDFDETLTPHDSFAFLLEELGFDADDFQRRKVQPLIDQGWEKYLARAYCLVQASDGQESTITQKTLAKVGEKIPLYDGTQQLFARLSDLVKSIGPEIELEFYLISGGFVDIARHTPIAKDFKQMWGCELAYGPGGEVAFMKSQMTHTAKTRYLYWISKGGSAKEDRDLMRDLIYDYDAIAPEDLHLPLDQVIYVGDGASDIPCFEVMNRYGGISLGIFSRGRASDWQHGKRVTQDQRLSNLVPASFAADSELVRSLQLGVEFLAKRILLRQMSQGE